MSLKKIKSALISVYYKDQLESIVELLNNHGVTIYSTGGTQSFIESLGGKVIPVESLTGYPSILDGRVKTLHPKIFGGILAIREDNHLDQLKTYDIPEIDLVVVDLYPFEETVLSGASQEEIIEKIDIGGISLIRAAAKNFQDVVIVASKSDYKNLANILKEKNCGTELDDRKALARNAFQVTSSYDTAIFNYFNSSNNQSNFSISIQNKQALRYGENPHQNAVFYGELEAKFHKFAGKDLSYNNLLDVDAAVNLIHDFQNEPPTFAILKHNNSCGLATRNTLKEAWDAALAGDPVSAFGGVFITNQKIDLATAESINPLFYEVLIAPEFDDSALDLLKTKKQRILLKQLDFTIRSKSFKSLLNGVIEQDTDFKIVTKEDLKFVTNLKPTESEIEDLLFANKCVKHLKSNGIALVKNKQLIGMGCGQTSRVDALKQAIIKAQSFGFDLNGAVMASEAFFPFPDCVEIAKQVGISAVIQPGGSIKDQDSIDYCNENELSMVLTGIRHFKH